MPTRTRSSLFIALALMVILVPLPSMAQSEQPTEPTQLSAEPVTSMEAEEPAELTQPSPAPTEPTQPSPAPIQPAAPPKPTVNQLNNENWSLALVEATPYLGVPVNLYAKVANVGSSDGTSSEFQVFTNIVSYPDGSLGVSYVIAPPGTQVKTDDYVRLEGTVFDMLEGINFVGATVRAPRVLATRVDMVTREEAYGPIIKTLTPGAQQATLGVTVTVERVELAQRETRVFVQVRNGGTGNASIDADGISFTQGGLSLRTKNPSGSGYSSIPRELRSRQEARGVFLFDPIQPTGSARLEWSSIRSGATTAPSPIVLDLALD